MSKWTKIPIHFPKDECKHGVRKNVCCPECSQEQARKDRSKRRKEKDTGVYGCQSNPLDAMMYARVDYNE